MKSPLLQWAAFLFALFHVYVNVFATIPELWFSAIHFGGFVALCALSGNEATVDHAAPPLWLRAVNVVLAALAVLVTCYMIFFEDALYAREAEFILSDYVVTATAVLLAIEFTRRTTGWFMPVLIMISLSYILFMGRYISGVFAFPGLSLETVLYRSYFSEEGMFGTTANISATYVFMFILFGSFLLKSGAGDFIVSFARCLAGRFTGGAGFVGSRQYCVHRRHYHSDDEAIGIRSTVLGRRGSCVLNGWRPDAPNYGCRCICDGQLHADPLPAHHRHVSAARHAVLPDCHVLCTH